MELLMIFGLTTGELIASFSFGALLIGGIIQMNVRMKGNEKEIEALKESTELEIKAVKETTLMEIKAVMEATNLRLSALESGRQQNATNIEVMRKENREDHKNILDKLDNIILESKGNNGKDIKVRKKVNDI